MHNAGNPWGVRGVAILKNQKESVAFWGWFVAFRRELWTHSVGWGPRTEKGSTVPCRQQRSGERGPGALKSACIPKGSWDSPLDE